MRPDKVATGYPAAHSAVHDRRIFGMDKTLSRHPCTPRAGRVQQANQKELLTP